MALLWGVVGYALWVYILLVLARVVVEWVRQFARSWRPAGTAAIGVELVYSATDPPIRLLRRLVPPLQLGTVSLDLSVIILLIVLIVARLVALTFA
ncbi:YggT family protein [Jatrophihabitans endophyticus]|uniref:YggT family protein n=1 Tax=Jatrophihabitans endophyticus TaxID=1206085 RepID=A0A1M5LB64_9ACTN|nr:YggT family protein [Jatrophihabitans endophyticus]SHG61959.1 YggT family protein [Jatrophihabitans endophyticus]